MSPQNENVVPAQPDPSRFCDDPERVERAIVNTNPADSGTIRLARRLKRAIVARCGGFTEKTPIVFLVVGPPHSEFSALAKAVAESFIGKPQTGIPAATIVESATGRTPPILDKYIERPDIVVRCGNETIPLELVAREAQQKGQNYVGDQNDAPIVEKIKGLIARIMAAMGEIIQQEREVAPYRSVIVCNNIAQAPPPIISILLPIVRDGYIETQAGEGHFDQSIVLLFVELADAALPPTTNGNRFRNTLELLEHLPNQEIKPLVEAVGEDNIIVIAPPTRESQKLRLDDILTRFSDTLAESFDIELVWAEGFREFLLNKSRQPDLGEEIYPTQRLDNLVRRFVYGAFAEKVVRREIRRGMRLEFTMVGSENATDATEKPMLLPEAQTTDEPLGDLVTARDVAAVFGEIPALPPMTARAKAFRKKLDEIIANAERETPGYYS